MFQNLYKYWYNVTDTPSVLFKLNIWLYINIRYFKFKFSRNLTYFISGIKTLKINSIKVFYKDWLFENFYGRSLKYVIFIVLISTLI